MSYPLDQITALAKANGELLLKFAEIVRTGSEDYVQIGSKAATVFVDQLKELKPGTVPSFRSDAATRLLSDIEKSREASVGKIKAAVDEWQGCCKDALSQAAGPQDLTDTIKAWFQPLLNTPPAEPEKAKVPAAPVRTPAKATETA